MKRKTFIKTSAALMAGSFFSSPASAFKKKPQPMRKNWAGNYDYKAKNLYEPQSVDELQTLVKKLGRQKALGTKHCFNDIADSPLNQISTKNLNKLLSIDEMAKTVTIEAGAKYGQFAPELDQKGYALHNLASLPHISVAGACSTATHGSGVKNGNLATEVSALEFVDGTGEIVHLSRAKDGDLFNGAVVSLGALGIITKVTLDVQKTYQVQQDVFQDLPLQSLKDHFDEILSAGYSVSLFTDWQDQKISQVWIKRKVDAATKDLGKDFFGATAAIKNLHPITKMSAENCTDQMGEPGVWYQRLPHFKMGFTPSSGQELQTEFFISRHHALEAILALEKIGSQIVKQLMITELRTIAADDLWLSMAYRQDSLAIHFTWQQHTPEVVQLLGLIEAELAPFKYRPHWGKLFTMAPPTLRSQYEKMPDFLRLMKKYDPQGKFRNAYLDLNIYSG